VELTRALTVLENARMEWNSARLKFPLLAGATGGLQKPLEENSPAPAFQNYSFGQLCRIGFALTWPVALVVLVIGVLMLLRR
jgi:hypothetical protein